MSKIQLDENLMRKIAKLARLKLTPEEEQAYSKDLSRILDYVEQLGEVKTEGVEPIVHGFPLEEHFREDKALALSEADTKLLIECSSGALYDQFRVPPMIGGES
jgi:aspartyl-tRNA(Asn)/glutamyl-tRNA(Gln) amidotransferase subunit C